MALVSIPTSDDVPSTLPHRDTAVIAISKIIEIHQSVIEEVAARCGRSPITIDTTKEIIYLRREVIRRGSRLSADEVITPAHLKQFLSETFGNATIAKDINLDVRMGTGKNSSKSGSGETIANECLQCIVSAMMQEFPTYSLAETIDFVADLDSGSLQGKIAPSIDIPLSIIDVHRMYLCSDTSNNTLKQNAESWIASSYWTAHALQKFFRGKDYIYAHQNSETGALLKTNSIAKIVSAFDLSAISSKPDVYNPADIFVISRGYRDQILGEFNTWIVNASDSDILDNYRKNRNTYKSITFRHLRTRNLGFVSLKKATASNPGLKLIATTETSAFPEFAKNLDNYTLFLRKLQELNGDTSKMHQMIESLVNIIGVNYKDSTVTYEVQFDLRWNDQLIDLDVEPEKLSMGTYHNTFNMKKRAGATAFYGGIGFDGLDKLLKTYRNYNMVMQELVAIRKSIWNELSPDTSMPMSLQQPTFVYKKKDLQDAGTILGKDLFQEFLIRHIIAVTQLARKTPPNRQELERDTWEKYSKTQALWLFTRPGFHGWLTDLFKKQIALTIYGVAAKKGGVIFEAAEQPGKSPKITQSAFKEFTIPPHIVVGQ